MVLAVDTSSDIASCAIVDVDKNILGEYSVLNKKSHSKVIVEMISNLLISCKKKIMEIDYFACSNGPGSYTGLRIGASCIKAFAYASNKRIVPVSALDALAYNVFHSNGIVCSVIEARNSNVFVAFYDNTSGNLTRVSDYLFDEISNVLAMACLYEKPVLFVGSGAKNYESQIKEYDSSLFLTGNTIANTQKASSIALLSLEYAKNGNFMNFDNFVPQYMGKSQVSK